MWAMLVPLTALMALKLSLRTSSFMALSFLASFMCSPHMSLPGVPAMVICTAVLLSLMCTIESNARLQFIAIIHSARLQKLVTETLAATRRSETSAFNAINHCAKRSMYNSIQVSACYQGLESDL